MATNVESKETETDTALLNIEKHPLQNVWKLWYFKQEKGKEWKDCNMPIYSFSTVEDFWSLYNHIELASNLAHGCDYSIFKDGIEPMWEDPSNHAGGRWVFQLNMKGFSAKGLNDIWLETILCLIGEGFGDESDEVNGAVINYRNKGTKIAVWTRDFRNKEPLLKIGKILKERLGINEQGHYEKHEDTESRKGSRTRYLYQI
ncbi:hypothetical protein B4U80_10742 [Leptotrombidium deliense]|uniref:eIF-4F 25 kDa subunit n=1 Tax=Leptotrombidium deliense TaxID=299467 RepID=A0A443SCB6_9ACAR|nr:hypothetical protein B4U80_10742 [Leptotrombidium deliense]